MVHDGVVDNITPKPTKVAFNLTDGLKAAKQAEKPPPVNQCLGIGQETHGLGILNESIHHWGNHLTWFTRHCYNINL